MAPRNSQTTQLSENAPGSSGAAMASWGGTTDGTEMLTWEDDDGFYGCLQGIYQGIGFEGEDQGPYETRAEVEEVLREHYRMDQQK
jgi:hypothetical protein